MQIIRDLAKLPENTSSVLTMGTFDGLHHGHRTIINSVVEIAKRESLKSVLLTYDPHPREILRKGTDDRLYLLTTIDERLEIIDELGIDICLVLPFTRELSMLSAKEYFDSIIAEKIGAKHILVGEDHAFGKGREGNAEMLKSLALKAGIEATIVKKIEFGGQKISSSSIRRALQRGDVETATEFLGRPYEVSGVVLKGAGVGKELGFPTANIGLNSRSKLIPAQGVYAVTVQLQDGTYNGMMNIGKRPTISSQNKIWLEVHIFKFAGNIYGEQISVTFEERLRDERKFHSRSELIRQLEKDKEVALLRLQQDINE